MPKKSKREKIRADIRRPTFQFRMSQPAIQQMAASPTADGELTAIKKDLAKTVVLATIAIAAEFILFWFERR